MTATHFKLYLCGMHIPMSCFGILTYILNWIDLLVFLFLFLPIANGLYVKVIVYKYAPLLNVYAF